jgi:tetratricopeptide (TPR) repeat protein
MFIRRIAQNKAKGAWVLGQQKLETKDFDQAISMFNQSLAFSPERYEPHLGLGQAYEGLGLVDIALREYQTAARLITGENLYDKVEKTTLLAKIGDIYLEGGLYAEAMEAYTKGISLNPKWPDPYYGLALAYHKVGDTKGARQALETYLRYETREKRAEKRNVAQELLKKLNASRDQ